MGRMLRGAPTSSSGAVGPSYCPSDDSVNSRRKFLGKICLFASSPVTCGAIAKDLRVMLDAQKIAYGAKLLTRNVMRLYSAHR